MKSEREIRLDLLAADLGKVIRGREKLECAMALAGLLGYVLNSFPKEEKQTYFKEMVRLMGNQIT